MVDRDIRHLRSLSKGFAYYAVFSAVVSLFPFVQLLFGAAILTDKIQAIDGEQPYFLGYYFTVTASLLIGIGLAIALGNFIAARYLNGHRGYYFCIAVAAIDCFFPPIGTLLGVFALIVLFRDSAMQLFLRTNQPTRENGAE